MDKQELLNILAEELELSQHEAKVVYDVLAEMIEYKLLDALPSIEDRIKRAIMQRLSETLAKF